MGIVFSEHNIAEARAMYEQERINPLTVEEMFKGALYAMLSAKQNHNTHIPTYIGMIEAGLGSPEAILADEAKVNEFTSRLNKSVSKHRYVMEFAEWWQASDIATRILKDVAQGRQRGFELREEIALRPSQGGAPGLGWKCASMFLRMCEYEKLVPVDTHAQTFLLESGYEVRKARWRTSGYSKSEYLDLEAKFSEVAAEYGYSAGFFQLVVWHAFAHQSTGQLPLF